MWHLLFSLIFSLQKLVMYVVVLDVCNAIIFFAKACLYMEVLAVCNAVIFFALKTYCGSYCLECCYFLYKSLFVMLWYLCPMLLFSLQNIFLYIIELAVPKAVAFFAEYCFMYCETYYVHCYLLHMHFLQYCGVCCMLSCYYFYFLNGNYIVLCLLFALMTFSV